MTEMTPATLTIHGVCCEGREITSAFKGRDPVHVWHGVGETCGYRVTRRTDAAVKKWTSKWSVTRETLGGRWPNGTGHGTTLAEALEDLEQSSVREMEIARHNHACHLEVVERLLSETGTDDV